MKKRTKKEQKARGRKYSAKITNKPIINRQGLALAAAMFAAAAQKDE